MDGWEDGHMHAWMDERDKWVDNWINRGTYICYVHKHIYVSTYVYTYIRT
jgi:hypothetical protein